MNKKSTILVIGSKGLVGSNLLNRLKKDNYINLHEISRKDCDLKETNRVNNIFKKIKPEYVFNCAARVGGIKENMNNQFGFLFENLMIQNNIIKSSIDFGVKKLINLGSSCIYPKDYIQPLKEEYILKAPVEPTNEGYAIAKIAGLKLCEYANKQNLGTNFISLMPCNIYGENDNFDLDKSHVLSALIKKVVDAKRSNQRNITCWGSGKQRREFMYVSDLIDCMIWSMKNIEKTDTFINVGTGYDVSIKELVKMIIREVGFEGEIIFDTTKPDGMLRKCLDISKITKLGWKPKISLEDGIKKTLNYYIKNFTS
jgi:GDP-L-fucose synthase